MNQFFKDLSEAMEDRQECIINIKKVEGDLVIMVTPDLKKKGTVIQMTGTPEDMDAHFIQELKKPIVAKAEFTSDVTTSDDEEEEDDVKVPPVPADKKKPSGKKKPEVKKAKPAAIKPGPKPKAKEEQATEKATEATPVMDEKKIAEQTAADKLKAEKAVADSKARNDKNEFDKLMAEGKAQFEARKYSEAEISFKEAVDLFPDNEKAKKELEQATKWVKALEKMNAE